MRLSLGLSEQRHKPFAQHLQVLPNGVQWTLTEQYLGEGDGGSGPNRPAILPLDGQYRQLGVQNQRLNSKMDAW